MPAVLERGCIQDVCKDAYLKLTIAAAWLAEAMEKLIE